MWVDNRSVGNYRNGNGNGYAPAPARFNAMPMAPMMVQDRWQGNALPSFAMPLSVPMPPPPPPPLPPLPPPPTSSMSFAPPAYAPTYQTPGYAQVYQAPSYTPAYQTPSYAPTYQTPGYAQPYQTDAYAPQPTAYAPQTVAATPGQGTGPLLSQGSVGQPVVQLQQRLTALGLNPRAATGTFDASTAHAVRAFQQQNRLSTDGIVGPQTWAALGVTVNGGVSAAPSAVPATPGDSTALEAALRAHLHNAYSSVVHACFSYAWAVVTGAGGRGIGRAQETQLGRGHTIAYLDTLISTGQLHVGDVVYVNRKPGADPSSTNLAYGPHWFVYMGNGSYADQYGQKANSAAMANFVPGRLIDSIYHTF